MRKSAYSAAAVVASVALLTVGVSTTSQAYTQKELNLCWANNTPSGTMDLEVVADGPSYKSVTLDGGRCTAFDVRAGQYKITVEDVQEFLDGIQAQCPGAPDPVVKIVVKRMNDSYKAYPLAALLNGSVTTNVRKDRRTTVSTSLKCV